jgi:ADP-heptose:LPS heptosyltransferase
VDYIIHKGLKKTTRTLPHFSRCIRIPVTNNIILGCNLAGLSFQGCLTTMASQPYGSTCRTHPLSALIPTDSMNKAVRVLYMTHMAIGDFVYQGPHLKALQQKFPNIQLDIWIDDLRDRSKSWHKRRNTTLCQWLEDQSFIHSIYPIAESACERQELIKQAQERHYDVIFFIATQRCDLYAKVARAISSTANIVGTRSKALRNPIQLWWRFKRIDGYLREQSIPAEYQNHISDLYGFRFQTLVGAKSATATLQISPPDIWHQRARDRLRNHADETVKRWLLINPLSTSVKRDLSWAKTLRLIIALHQTHPSLGFVLNLPPDQLQTFQRKLAAEPAEPAIKIVPFTAKEHFYELPAMLSCVDYVVTVETAIMHLAASVGTRQTALVRDSAKHWRPMGDSQVVECQGNVDSVDITDLTKRITAHIG